MGLQASLVICALGVALLFYFDRFRSYRPSKALYIVLVFLLVNGSRPISIWLGTWLGTGPLWTSGATLEAQLDGSPLDASFYALLLLLGLIVLMRRRNTTSLLKVCTPIIVFYCYCLLSVCWSHIFAVALKRWVKDLLDIVVVLLLLTEPRPIEALRWIFTRAGYVLLPVSIVLAKYSSLGRAYDPSGVTMITGVSTNKNSLGMIAYFLSIGVFWSFVQLFGDPQKKGRARRIFAQGTLVITGILVLQMAHSATSLACFVIGAGLITATYLPFIQKRPRRLHAFVVVVLCLGAAFFLFGGESLMVGVLGRDTTFTGRTDIWKTVIPMCPNPLFGAGFESFWNTYGGNLTALGRYLKGINEAHNGYIELYLNLGWVGLLLMIGIIFICYQRVGAALRKNRQLGSLALAYVITCVIYCITEAGFRELTVSWISFLLAFVIGSDVVRNKIALEAGELPKARRPHYVSRWAGVQASVTPLLQRQS